MKRVRAGSSIVLGAGAAVLALAAVAFGQVFVLDRARALEQQQGRHALLARVFEEQASREADAAAQLLGALSQLVSVPGADDPAQLSARLEQGLSTHRSLRELALLDLNGRILAGSRAGRGATVELARLGPLPPEDRAAMGQWVAGRYLGDGPVSAAPSVGFVPVMRRVVYADEPALLVATLHPEAFAVAMRVALADAGGTSALLSLQGQVLAHSAGVLPGTMRSDRAPLAGAAGPTSGAVYQGAGLEDGTRLGAWRSSTAWPLVVVVESSRDAVLAAWWRHVRAHVVVAAAALVLMALCLALAWRALRLRERLRRHRDRIRGARLRRERELAGLVGHLQTLLFRTDRDGRLGFVNPRWARLLGPAADALPGQPLAAAFADADRAAVGGLFAEPMAGVPRSVRAWLVDRGGQRRRFELMVVPLIDATGINGFAGSAVEVTTHEVERARLQADIAFHARLIELSPLPVSLLDDRGCYVQVNRAWEAFTGRRRESILGQPAAGQLPGHEAERHAEEDMRLRAAGGTVSYESPYTRPDGSRRDLVISKARLADEGVRAPLILCLVTDVTELRAAERATQRARVEAERTQVALAALAAEMAQALEVAVAGGPEAAGPVRARLEELAVLAELQGRDMAETARVDLAALASDIFRSSAPGAAQTVLQLPPGPLPVPGPAPAVRRLLQQLWALAGHGARGPVVVDGRVGSDGAVSLSLGIPPATSARGEDGAIAMPTRLSAALGVAVMREGLAEGGERVRLEWPAVSAAR